MKTNLSSKTVITIFILFLNITVVQNLKAQVTLDWVTQIGSTGGEEGHSIVADSLGNTYVLGTYPSGNNLLDFDNSSNTVTLPVGNGFITAFLAKFDINGNLIWVNSVIDNNSTTSNNYIYPQELSIDNNNNIIVFSSFRGSTFDADPSSGVLTLNNPGYEAILVSKFNSLGNFIWATTAAYGTSNLSNIDPQGVDIDSQNNIFLTGIFNRTIQFTATDSITSVNATNLSLYVIKLDPSGNFLWAKAPNTSSPQQQYSIGYSIHLDNSDNIMVTGYFYGDVDFDLGAGAHVVTSAAPSPAADLFVLKLDNNGDFIWVKNYGNANGRLLGIDVNIDATGNIIIAGALSSFPAGLVDIDPGGAVLNINNGGAYESFVLKLDANGNNQWIKNIAANTSQTELFNVATDNCGNIYSIGRFKGTCDFDPGPTTFNMTSGIQNIFISKLDSSGNFVWAHNFGEGSTFADKDNDIFIDNNSNIYFTAGMGTNNLTSPAADFDPGIGTHMLTTNGRFDIVLGKLIDCCLPTIAQPISFIGTTTFCNGDSIILDAGAGYSTYQWLPSNDTTQLITVSSSGNYAVIISDNCGTDTSQTITITVNPSVTFSQTFNECQGFSTTVGTNTYNTTGIYIDTLTTNTGCDSIITTNLTINASSTTTQVFNECEGFSITVGTNTYTTTGVFTDVINSCDTIITDLTINPNPIINLINDITITQGSSTNISASGGGTYLWSPSTNLSCDICAATIASPLFSTNYCVDVTAPNGCTDTKCVNVNVDFQCGELFVPNVFSPNGDGNNDVLEVKINPTCVTNFNIKIFDRWGEKVFESDDINNSWDGTYKGKPLNSAVFVYHLAISLINSEIGLTKKGNISLIK